jgi:hypothetical protein
MLLDICLKTTYFRFDGKFYQQKDGMAMGNSFSGSQQHIHGIFRGNSFGHGRLQTR